MKQFLIFLAASTALAGCSGTATPPTEYDPAYFTDGILALIAAPKANPFDPLAGHKTLAYWGRLRPRSLRILDVAAEYRMKRVAGRAQPGETVCVHGSSVSGQKDHRP